MNSNLQTRIRQLYTDLTKLKDSQIDKHVRGMEKTEPPKYHAKPSTRQINGATQTTTIMTPKLENVEIKQDALACWVGPVSYTGGHVADVTLEIDKKTNEVTVKKGEVNVLPGEGIIPCDIATELADLFQKRYQAIVRRVDAINHARHTAARIEEERNITVLRAAKSYGELMTKMQLTQEEIRKNDIKSYKNLQSITGLPRPGSKRSVSESDAEQASKKSKIDTPQTP